MHAIRPMLVASAEVYRFIKVKMTRGCGRRLCDNAFYFRIPVVRPASTRVECQIVSRLCKTYDEPYAHR